MGNCQKDQTQEVDSTQRNGPVSEIRITNYIWNKDYQGLFDYDTKSIDKKTLKIKGNAILGKAAGKYELFDDKSVDLNENQLKSALFRVVQKDNWYQVHPIYIESENYTLQKLLWLVVSSLPMKSHVLQEKDILKLGKQKVRVREIVLEDSNPSMNIENIKLTKTVYQDLTFKGHSNKTELKVETEQIIKESHSEITTSDQVCRICLDPGEFDNPLITPCKCSGSVKYIHLNCLKAWLAKRLNAVKNPHCITINWLPLSCEMCKAPFRYRIYMDNKKFYTVDIPKPPKPYVVVQLMRKNNSTKGKVFHFISFAEKHKVNLGRRKDIDVRVSQDISISRAHASIQYDSESKQFRLFDNKSKFGTLVLIKKGLIVRPTFSGTSFQVGAEVFSFQAMRGPGPENYAPEEGDINDYMAEIDSEEDEDMEEGEEGQSESENDQNENPMEGEESSPVLRHRNSVPAQQN